MIPSVIPPTYKCKNNQISLSVISSISACIVPILPQPMPPTALMLVEHSFITTLQRVGVHVGPETNGMLHYTSLSCSFLLSHALSFYAYLIFNSILA